MVGELYELGLLTGLDRAALSAYCVAYGRWVQAEKALVKQPLVVKSSPRGMLRPNSLILVASQAMREMMRCCVEFGLTPAARSRIHANPPTKEKDAAAEYLEAA